MMCGRQRRIQWVFDLNICQNMVKQVKRAIYEAPAVVQGGGHHLNGEIKSALLPEVTKAVSYQEETEPENSFFWPL